jgi:endonuclease YncB( thermonuclease family)
MNRLCCLLIGPALLAAAVVCQISNAKASEIKEYAIVIDGDTLLIRDVIIRLDGIDAPELGQRCTSPTNLEWDCGRDAKRMLTEKIGRGPVSCRQLHFDADGQVLASCAASNGDDLAATMVHSGYALADGRRQRYLGEEMAARMAGRGMWSGSFQTPWEWRAQQLDAEDE